MVVKRVPALTLMDLEGRMIYRMRFIVDDESVPEPEAIGERLADEDPHYALRGDSVLFEGRRLAGVRVLRRGEEAFAAERSSALALAGGSEGEEVAMLRRLIESSSAIVAVDIPLADGSFEEAIDLLEPLWDDLEENHNGVIWAEGEGFYDEGELIVETK
jgi:hypothetical protein